MKVVNIIPFSQKYLDSLIELEKICFTMPWTREMFEEEFKSSLTHYFIAVENDAVVGYAGLWKILDEGQITNIAVLPDYRRRGIADKLINALISSTSDIKSYTLEVRESNTAARALYEKLGFAVVGTRKGYYSDNGENAILYARALTTS